MIEIRYRRYIAFGLCLFLIAPILIIGGISTALLTETKEEFDVFYHVIFLGALNIMALVTFIGTMFRLVELRKYDGDIVSRSPFSKQKGLVPKTFVYFTLIGILLFSSFMILTTVVKFIESTIALIEYL